MVKKKIVTPGQETAATLDIPKARIIAEEAWRMLPDSCKEIMGEQLKATYIDSIEADINEAYKGTIVPPVEERKEGEAVVYEITEYSSDPEYWTLIDAEGNNVKVDLASAGELDQEMGEFLDDDKGMNSYFKWCRSLVGRKVQIDELVPNTAAGKGIKLIAE